MSDSLIMSMYEEGRTVKEIAEAMGTAPSEVTALLAKTDDTQTVQVVRQEKHIRKIRRVRALADGMTMAYMETLRAVIDDAGSTADEKKAAFAEMDKVLRIAKQYADRVLLAEGKATANVGRPRLSVIAFCRQ
jgi:DNA-binding transcriptional regulator LsrR (DeoR family)